MNLPCNPFQRCSTTWVELEELGDVIYELIDHYPAVLRFAVGFHFGKRVFALHDVAFFFYRFIRLLAWFIDYCTVSINYHIASSSSTLQAVLYWLFITCGTPRQSRKLEPQTISREAESRLPLLPWACHGSSTESALNGSF